MAATGVAAHVGTSTARSIESSDGSWCQVTSLCQQFSVPLNFSCARAP